MKKFTIWLLSAVFVTLIACSIQSISADHESSEGIFKDKSRVNLVTTQDSDYQVYLQAVLRNGDGQLINVTENTKTAAYIPHEIADYVFDTLMGEKEIVTIDNIKYEKVQYTFSPTLEQRWIGMYPIFEQVPIEIKVEGQLKKADRIFSVMENLYQILYPFAMYDKIVKEARRKLDVNRVLVEETRAVITEEIRRNHFVKALTKK